MPAATYDCLKTTTTTTGQGTITLNNISQAYTDLVVVVEGGSQVAANGIALRLNGDTSNSYALTQIGGQGSGSAQVAKRTLQSILNINFSGYWLNTTRGLIVCHIMNYANTNMFKNVISRASTPATGIDLIVGTYWKTDAITEVNITNDGSGNIGADTMVSIYGIKAE